QQSAREVLLAEPGRPAAAEGRGHDLGALRAGRVAGVGDHGVSSGLTMRRALRLIFRKAQIAEAVDDELAFHLDMRTQRLIAFGNTARVSSMSQGSSRLDILSYPMYKEVRQRAPMFQGILASGRADRVDLVVDGHEAEHPRTRYVSGNYFAVLGVPAALGRTFGDVEDGAPGVSPVAVISHDYWMRRFSGDRGAIGKKILFNDVPLTVVGVASAGFQGEVVGTSYDVWLPITM